MFNKHSCSQKKPTMVTAAALLDPERRMPNPRGHVRALREFGEVRSDNGVPYLMEPKDDWKTLPVFKPEQFNIRGNRGIKLRGCGVQGAVAAAVEHYAETRKAIASARLYMELLGPTASSSNLDWQRVMPKQRLTAPSPPTTMLCRAAARPYTSRWTPSPMHMVDEDDLYTRSGRNNESDTDSDTDSENGDGNIEQSPQKPTNKQRDNHVLHALLMDDASDDEEGGNARLNPRQHRAVETMPTTAAPNVTQPQQQTVASQPTSTTHQGTEAAKPRKKFRKFRKACSAMRRACTAAVSAAFTPSTSKSDKKDK